MDTESEKSARRAATASAIGSLVEWYDFALYGAAAALVFNQFFFHADNPAVGLMASFATFAVATSPGPSAAWSSVTSATRLAASRS